MVAPKRGQKLSWEVRTEDGSKPVGESRIRRSYVLGKKEPLVTSPCEGVYTMFDIANYAAAKHGDRPFLGTRPIIRVHPAEGALELYELGPYAWLSFIEVRDLMLQAGAGLRQLGLGRPANAQAAADAPFLTIYSETSLNWRLLSMGAASISSPFSTAFSTLDTDGVKHTINLPGSVAVFTQGDLLLKLAGILKGTPTVKTVIYDGQADSKALQAIRDLGTRTITVDELLRLGRAYPAAPTPPKADDLYAVQFTSGTSGLPKGVEVTHQMMLSAVAAIDRLLGDDHYKTPYEQSHCAFLPLAHVIAAASSANLWFQGVKSGFGRARTLMATGVKNCQGDLAELKPTTIEAVPLVWETIRKAVELQLSQAPPVTRGLFNVSYFAKEHGIPLLAQVGDVIVLSKIRAFTGGRLDACLSGGAALSASTNAWFRATGIASIQTGYGLTETTGMGCISHPTSWTASGDGASLMACVEVKLIDRPESGYRTTDALPSGEIAVRGPAVFRRYYKNPEATAEVFDKDGFFLTGDIGRFTAAGALVIVDRVKNLVKLPNGEYIALEKNESILKACPIVANLILVLPVGADAVSTVAIPHAANLFTLLKARGLLPAAASVDDPASVASVVRDPKVRRVFLSELNAFGKAAGLSRRELIGHAVLTSDVWDPDSGMVTATMKPKRKAIESRYAAELEAANTPRARL